MVKKSGHVIVTNGYRRYRARSVFACLPPAPLDKDEAVTDNVAPFFGRAGRSSLISKP